MKIGILTLYYHSYNFGGVLQAYALCRYLNQSGYEAEQIAMDFTLADCFVLQAKSFQGLKKLRPMLSYGSYKLCQKTEKIRHPEVAANIRSRKERFDKFGAGIPHSQQVYHIETVKDANAVYDLFLCGSDVIWNCGMPASVAALGFTQKPRIAYAPSIGQADLPDWWKKAYLPYVEKLNVLSMREKGAAEELEQLLGRHVEHAVDPTLLLTPEEWNACIGTASGCQSTKECFCYLLGDDRAQRKQITEFARKQDLNLVTEPYAANQSFRRCDKCFGDIQDYSSGPMEFIEHIRNADVVLTDSFHACVFSILYNKEFYALPRINGKDQALSGRIQALLQVLGIQDRYTQDLSQLKRSEIDYTDVNKALAELREKSADFLKTSLHEVEHSF